VATRSLRSRLIRGIALLGAVAVGVSVVEVLAVRCVDPPLTWTMVDRVLAHHAETGEWQWVDYRPLDLDALGPAVAHAAVSSEDARFWLHNGFDWEALCKAYDHYDGESRHLHGGSTISQQVAKNVFLWQQRSFLRKGLEAWYTVLLEALVPKERILEHYLDVAETGELTFGFEAGAWRYWHRPAAKLTALEAAELASILPSPRKWSPMRDPAAGRAQWVIAHPAPFPGDRSFDEAERNWEQVPGPLSCLVN
jgi:monofunctional biosynthetic peptidoglycan transglycosylase